MGTRWPEPIEDSLSKRRWYRRYIRSLDELQGETYDPQKADAFYEELFDDEHWDFWVPVKLGRKTVGFFTMCPMPHCSPNADYWLRDAYVHPKYRCLGAMKKAVTRWLQLYPGVYEVLVLNQNRPAYNCWLKIFQDAGYIIEEQYHRTDKTKDDSTLFRFKPKEESQLQLRWHPHRENLYTEYRKEMDDMQQLSYNISEYAMDLWDFLEDNNKWIPIVHNGEEVGFICMCQHPCCHPDADWFLREAYVRPEYRRKGLMRQALLKFLKRNPGRYCLFVMENNITAQKCWQHIFDSAGYVPIKLRQLEEFKDVKVPLYGFKPKKKEDHMTRYS